MSARTAWTWAGRTAFFSAIAACFFWNWAYYYYWIFDDAYITLAYARNLVEGAGLAYNSAGGLAEHVEGYSNPSMALLFAGALALRLDAMQSVKILSFASVLGIALILFAWSRTLFRNKALAYLPPVLIAGSISLAEHGQSGLETDIMAFLLLLSLWLMHSEKKIPFLLSAPLFLLAMLCRPEGIALLCMVLFLFAAELARARFARRDLRRYRAWIGLFAALYAPYLLWHFIYYSGFFANSASAKVSHSAADYLHAWRAGYFLSYFLYSKVHGAFLAAGLLAGAFLSYRKGWLAVWLAILASFAFCWIAREDYFPNHRFLVPYIPFLCLAATGGYDLLASLVPGRIWKHIAAAGIFAAGIAAAAGDARVATAFVHPALALPAPLSIEMKDYRQFADLAWWRRTYWSPFVNVANIAACLLGPDEAIAYGNIGYLKLASRAQVIDLAGLTDREAALYRTTHGAKSEALMKKLALARPAMLMLGDGDGMVKSIAGFKPNLFDDYAVYEKFSSETLWIRKDRAGQQLPIETVIAKYRDLLGILPRDENGRAALRMLLYLNQDVPALVRFLEEAPDGWRGPLPEAKDIERLAPYLKEDSKKKYSRIELRPERIALEPGDDAKAVFSAPLPDAPVSLLCAVKLGLAVDNATSPSLRVRLIGGDQAVKYQSAAVVLRPAVRGEYQLTAAYDAFNYFPGYFMPGLSAFFDYPIAQRPLLPLAKLSNDPVNRIDRIVFELSWPGKPDPSQEVRIAFNQAIMF